ncbi:hypothetical protein K488DRAFT_88058 [Vararia minispora EC-137]|uniref:Uncharacterized protein n=1 Tax=Vararia minispora EC-137 TaxID=1314806 RepID=A0ACB8QEP5_9AGAM|nr:hypothetical protein K488DRAFT_88058 [Vararia minispora EC-137]
MDVDAVSPPAAAAHDPHDSHPVAGPSTLFPVSPLFLLPPAPIAPPPLLTCSEDILQRFHLLPAYDKFVRPVPGPVPSDKSTNHPPNPDKGKGKEKEGDDNGEGVEDEVEKDWRRQNNYRYLIKGLPGSHSTKKDNFLGDKVNAPPKQHIDVVPFEFPLERNPFIVDGLGIPGWAGKFDEETSKEERRRRKEAKRQAKMAAVGLTQIDTSVAASTPAPATSTPTTATPVVQSAARARDNTPRPATPTNTTAPPRGVKREREPDEPSHPPMTGGRPANGVASSYSPPNANGATPAAVRPAQINGTMTHPVAATNGRAGVEGARPRPKKPRMDIQGQAREMLAPAQQPTPQGV